MFFARSRFARARHCWRGSHLLLPSALCCIFGLLVGGADNASAGQVSLAWDPNPEPDVIGYRLHYGTSSGQYSHSVNVGQTTTAALTDLTEDTRYFAVVTAYNAAGLESPPSNEVEFVIGQAVIEATNELPMLSVESPDGNRVHVEPATLLLYATLGSHEENAKRVEFYDGTERLGASKLSPWSLIWRNVGSGQHELTAVVYFPDGSSLQSEPLTVGVEARTTADPPRVSSEASKLLPIPIQTISEGSKADSFLIFASGQEGEWLRIQKSDDLIHWSPLGTLQIKSGYSYLIDHDALDELDRRYYRIVKD